MQQRRELDQSYTNRKLLNGQLDTPKWWAPTVTGLGILVVIGLVVIATMINKGLGVTGLRHSAWVRRKMAEIIIPA